MQHQPLLLLDGGTGHLLKARGLAIPGLPFEQQFLAGVLANEAAPQHVRSAHAAYLASGCDVLTTNNFAATRHSLAKVGRQADVVQLTQLAGQLARQAVRESGRQGVLLAGCLPPLQESYQAIGLPPHQQMVAEYREVARALEPHVDVLLAETLSTSAEAAAALEAAAPLGKPVWVSFTLEDSTAARLRSQELLSDAIHMLQAHQSAHLLAALLLNCCAPAAVSAALPVLAKHVGPGVRVGCYANGFQTTTTQWLQGDAAEGLLPEPDPGDYDADGTIMPAAYARHAAGWLAGGASIIGGCCGVGPEHMQHIALALAARLTQQDDAAGGDATPG